MKYYSEKLNKLFDSEKELQKAEVALTEQQTKEKKLRDERAKRAKEVENAYLAYKKLLNQFIEDYGSYHQSIKNKDEYSILDLLFGYWPF